MQAPRASSSSYETHFDNCPRDCCWEFCTAMIGGAIFYVSMIVAAVALVIFAAAGIFALCALPATAMVLATIGGVTLGVAALGGILAILVVKSKPNWVH